MTDGWFLVEFYWECFCPLPVMRGRVLNLEATVAPGF